MEAAKAAVNKFTGQRGHKTSVDEVVNPAVTKEAIHPHKHEEVVQAVDREVQQHHYHTTVQPVKHQEVLPEKHVHNQVPVQHKEYRHEDDEETKAKVAAELGRFQSSTTIHDTKHTQEAAPAVTGERVHHHVHETVVPVIQKQTIQPEVVHTTVPVHETHIEKSQHHGLSALPMKSLDEFKQAGGILSGSKSSAREEYEGQPRQYNDKLSTTFEKLDFPGHHGSNTTGTTSTTGLTDHRNTDSGIGTDSPNSTHNNGLAASRESGLTGGRDGGATRGDLAGDRDGGLGQSHSQPRSDRF